MNALKVHLRRLCFLFSAVLFSAAGAWSETRLALVVGNESYEVVSPLDNPVADARLVAAALTAKGFEVTLVTNADQSAFNRAIALFGRELRAQGENATGLFYYAGHAVQSFGANYLLPVDVTLTDAADLGLVAVRADSVLHQMASARNPANIVILDACRNNPFVDIPDMNDNGLAEMKAPTGTFMAFSTAPGSVAVDGLGSNSPFTSALVNAMEKPGLPIEQAFKEVRGAVLEATGGQQTPWDTSSLTMDFRFTPVVQPDPAELAADKFFKSVKDSGDPVQIVLFLRTYPDSKHFDAARDLLSEALDENIPSVGVADMAPADPGDARTGPSPTNLDVLEREMIERAQSSGLLEDYRAYLEAYPTGVFAELAAMEISEKAAMDPDAPSGGLAVSGAEEPKQSSPISAGTSNMRDVTFDAAITHGNPVIDGQSIAALVGGSPLFPPIAGLPENVWKNRPCAACHEWTKEALCDQSRTYLAEAGTRTLTKEHPYGGSFKAVLRDWAGGGCR